jgi:hypothetical protein
MINGNEVTESRLILGTGPKDATWGALPPGDNLHFDRALGSLFNEPGIYRVSWQGEGFQSPEITLRILPAPPC